MTHSFLTSNEKIHELNELFKAVVLVGGRTETRI